MSFVRVLRFALPLAAGGLVVSAGAQDAPLVLGLPIDCRFGESCFVQQYFDHDPGPGAKDYRCGPMSYEGHDGVDLRLPTMVSQKQGVAVLAAAAGVVRGMRDGMEDVSVAIAGPNSVKGRECGNGLVILHPGGWETQYCHMAKGSLRVRSGQEVTTGTPLGMVGMSGDAEFPHLHFSVRKGAEKIDPFGADATPGACGGKSLWSSEAAAALSYRSPELINWGFDSRALTGDDIEAGRAGTAVPEPGSPALLAYVRAIGLKAGDEQSLSLRGPSGTVLAENRLPMLVRDRAQQFLFAGKRRVEARWPSGRYEALFTVRRDGAMVIERRFAVMLP